MIKKAIKHTDSSFQQKFERFIQSRGLLVNSGYLTIKKIVSPLDNIYQIRIPHQEVQREIINLTEYYLSIDDKKLSKKIRFLIDEQKELFLQEYKNILMLPSYHDLKNKNSYHMTMLGIGICLSKDCKIKSNQEKEKRRCDILLKAIKPSKTSYVIEFKYMKNENKDIYNKLKVLANEAVKQISKKNIIMNYLVK